MPLDQRPQPIGAGVVERAVVEHGGAAEERHAEQFPRAHHPADVAHPVHGVARLYVEGVGHVLCGLDGEAAVRMHRAFGPSRGARGVDQHQRVFGRGTLGDRGIRLRVHERRPQPVVRAGDGRGAEARHHDHVPDRRRGADRGVGHLLHLDALPPAPEAVGGDEHRRLGVLEPRGHGVGTVAREQRQHDRADLRAGEEGGGEFRSHRQEEGDPVTLAYAQLTQGVGAAIRGGAQLGVGEGMDHTFFAFTANRRLAVRRGAGPLVETVVDDVETAVHAPPRPRRAAGEIDDLRERLVELDPEIVEDGTPEPLEIGHRSVEQRGEIGDPVTAHEGGQPAPLDDVGRRPPRDLAAELEGLPVHPRHLTSGEMEAEQAE